MKNLWLILNCLVLTLPLGCKKVANTLSEKEIISLATKKLNEPKLIQVIGYDPNTLVKRSFASTSEGWHKVVFTDTLHGIDLHVLVSPEGFTEISFDPKPGIQPDNNQIVTPSDTSSISTNVISKSDAEIIAAEQLFRPGVSEQIGCDPHHLSNVKIHYMETRWIMVTYDAEIEKRRIFVVVRPDRTAEIVFVSKLDPGNYPFCDY